MGYGGGSDPRLFHDTRRVGPAAAVRRVPEPGTLIQLVAGLLVLIPILARKRSQEEKIG
jgi:hypothetical protein